MVTLTIIYSLHCALCNSDVQRVQWRKLDQFPEETDEAYHVDDELNVDYRFKINNNEYINNQAQLDISEL